MVSQTREMILAIRSKALDVSRISRIPKYVSIQSPSMDGAVKVDTCFHFTTHLRSILLLGPHLMARHDVIRTTKEGLKFLEFLTRQSSSNRRTILVFYSPRFVPPSPIFFCSPKATKAREDQSPRPAAWPPIPRKPGTSEERWALRTGWRKARRARRR